ncbi:MAG: magnesium transporter, partial [Clostridia bacterium]|nr:magnesium transporter [Clostridia bacterium]
MIEELVALFETEEFDKLEKLAYDTPIEELSTELSKLDKDLLVKIFPKLPEDISAECFLRFKSPLQRYLVDNISGMQFKDITDEILDTENVEEELKTEIFNDIMIQAEADVRHEKLLEIIDKIENKAFSSLKPILTEMRPIDIAELINDIDEEKVLVVFRLLPKYLANQTFVEMDSDTQEIVIKAFTDKELSGMINDLFVDDTVDLIEEMPSNVVRRILKVADKETRAQINKLMGFPKDSAGSIMTVECITLRPWMTADEALAKMRRQAFDKETIYTCYVTDDEKRLLGIVTAKDIIIHNPTDKIGDFMHDNIISAHTHTDKEEVSNLLAKYDLLAIPILDNEDRINGIVTIDDAIDVIQEEATEDISKINAVLPTSKPYLQASVFSIFRNRLPWLLILLISATFTGLIINIYEGTLNSLSPLLFACVPMLMGTGGNSGSQASVTIIQALAMNEVSFRDTFRVLWKEVRVAILVALALAIACFGKLMLIDNLLLGYDYTVKISLVVSISL